MRPISRTFWLLFPVYLMHVSAIIGISIGYKDFFLPKSFLNLAICFVLLLLAIPKQPLKQLFIPLLVAFVAGMGVEALGVATGAVFGEYEYGNGLGPKIMGVPWIIGINWALLVFVTFDISRKWSSVPWVRWAFGASLMVALDLVMEQVASWFDFWEFEGGLAGPINYVAWWILAFVLHAVINHFNPKGNRVFSWHLFAVQFAFFAYFYVRNSL